MRAKLLWLGLVLLSTSSGCGGPAPGGATAVDEATAGIVDGIDAGGRALNVGTMVFRENEAAPWTWFDCTGTMLAPKVFLTAGHCAAATEFYPGYQFAVTFAPRMDLSVDPFWPAVPPDAKVYAATPQVIPTFAWPCEGCDLDNAADDDVGVMLLDQPVRGVSFAVLPPVGFFDAFGPLLGIPAFGVVGYGLTDSDLLATGEYDWGTRRFTTMRYGSLFPRRVLLERSPGSSCWGDSGGPAFPIFQPRGALVAPRYVLFVSAIASSFSNESAASGLWCNDPGPMLFQRLDLRNVHEFLRSFLR
jgi:hypothetical protein